MKELDLFSYQRAPTGTIRNFAGSAAKRATPKDGSCPRCLARPRLVIRGKPTGYCSECRRDYAKARSQGVVKRTYRGDGLCRDCCERPRVVLGPNAKHPGKQMSYCGECSRRRARDRARAVPAAAPSESRRKNTAASRRSRFRNRVREFWKLVVKTDSCWNWNGGFFPNGYGQFSITWPDGRCERAAHRIAFRLSTNEDPDGIFVLHECDNKRCVNPAHLHLGTHHDNMVEAEMRGRTGGVGSLAKKHGLSIDELLAAVAAAGNK